MDQDKNIDESWKDNVGQQKDLSGCSSDGCGSDCGCGTDCHSHNDHEQGEMQVNFFNYLMSMAYQAMIFLGDAPNPSTGKTEQNIRQAKFLIDTLKMVQEKTKGNLTQEEESFFSSSLYELQMKFVAALSKQK